MSEGITVIPVFAVAESQLLPVKRWDMSGVLLFQGTCKMGKAKFKLLWLISESVDNLTGFWLGSHGFKYSGNSDLPTGQGEPFLSPSLEQEHVDQACHGVLSFHPILLQNQNR